MNELPVLPPVEPAVLRGWAEGHDQLAASLTSCDRVVLHQARRIMRRQFVEAIANLQPVIDDEASPFLFPPDRRFLSQPMVERMRGADVTFRHIDAAIEMSRLPDGPELLRPESPMVLNALLAGPVTEKETNPGLVRMTTTHWASEVNSFEHAPPAVARRLLSDAIDFAGRAPAPSIARAGWLAFVMMTVHPFVDGNGRTARALFAMLSGVDNTSGPDSGALEHWNLSRSRYMAALKAGQLKDLDSGVLVDAGPFIDFAVRSSIRGAAMNATRVAHLSELYESLTGDQRDRQLLMQVLVERLVPIDDIAVGPVSADLLARAGSLVAAGQLAVQPEPVGAALEHVGRRGLVVGPGLVELATSLRSSRYVD